MSTAVDLIVLGTGEAARSVAYPCREAGWRVAVVDYRPYGGTCQLRGCDPKKVLVGVADALAACRRLEGKGLVAPDLHIAWSDLQRFKRTFTDSMPGQNEASFAAAGILQYHGTARFTGPTSVRVEAAARPDRASGADGVDHEEHDELTARHVVIATGAEPRRLGIPGEDLLTSSEQFLELEELPHRIVFVGGGYISFEFAHVAARAGAEVQIVQRGERPLEGFDPDLVALLVASTRELGVEVRLNATVTGVEQGERRDGARGPLRVRARSGSAGTDTDLVLEADLVVHGAGRTPELGALALEAAGVAFDPRRGVRVNTYLQSVSNPAVYAAGDAADGSPLRLTPVADLEGGIVAQNLLRGNTQVPNSMGTPTVVYTIPPLARVGLLEREAQEQGLRYHVQHEDTSGWYSSRRVGLAHTGFKTLIEEGTGRLLGAHVVGDHADEVINLFALAMRHGLTADALKDVPYAYPTSSSDVAYMA